MSTYVVYVFFVLGLTIIVQSKNEIENIQKAILDEINETAPDFEPCNEILLQKAVFGDMIEIKRPYGYCHWCVYFRDANVISLNNPELHTLNILNAFNNFTGNVEMPNLIDLAKQDFCRINNKISESKRKGLHALCTNEIEARMNDELKHNITLYNLIEYNCEHFAAKLKFGVPFSSQIEAVMRIVESGEFKETVVKMFEVAVQASIAQHRNESDADPDALNFLH